MSSERSISPDPLPRSHSRSSVIIIDDKDGDVSAARPPSASAPPKRRRESSNHTPTPSRSATSRSNSRSSTERSKSPNDRNRNNRSSPSPPQPTTKRHRRRSAGGETTGRPTCAICSCDVRAAKRLFGVLDNCDHIFCYECIVSRKRSKYNNSESESCPICKVRSAFITPSKYWYDNKDDKYRIVKKHKNHLKTLPCRYYLRHGFCRYSDRCFYDHHEAARQYRQTQQPQHAPHAREPYANDYYHGNGGHRSYYYASPPPPPAPPSSGRYSSSRYRDRAY